jgi:hypothetical protein
MFSWFRKIRRINIFGFELEFDHSAVNPTEFGEAKTPSATRKDRLTQADIKDESPTKFTVYVEVIGTIDKDLGIRIRNEDEVREFWRINRIDSKLDWMGKGPPVFSIGRKEDSERCKPGDEVSMTFVVQERAGGKGGIRTVAFEVLRKN